MTRQVVPSHAYSELSASLNAEHRSCPPLKRPAPVASTFFAACRPACRPAFPLPSRHTWREGRSGPSTLYKRHAQPLCSRPALEDRSPPRCDRRGKAQGREGRCTTARWTQHHSTLESEFIDGGSDARCAQRSKVRLAPCRLRCWCQHHHSAAGGSIMHAAQCAPDTSCAPSESLGKPHCSADDCRIIHLLNTTNPSRSDISMALHAATPHFAKDTQQGLQI